MKLFIVKSLMKTSLYNLRNKLNKEQVSDVHPNNPLFHTCRDTENDVFFGLTNVTKYYDWCRILS